MISRKRLGVIGGLATLAASAAAWSLSGATMAAPADAALSACQAQVGAVQGKIGGQVKTVTAAFAASASKVADWQEHRGPPDGPKVVSTLRNRASTDALTVCYFDGLFLAPGGPPSDKVRPPYDRLIAIVDAQGNLILDTATWQSTFPVVDPSK